MGSAARAVAVAVLLAGALALVYLIALGTGPGSTLDGNSVVTLDPVGAPRIYEATRSLLETVSVVSIALFGAAVAGVALVRGRPELALGALGLIVAANATTQLLQAGAGQARPDGRRRRAGLPRSAGLALARAPELVTAVAARTSFFLAAAGLTLLAFAVPCILAAVLERRGGRPA